MTMTSDLALRTPDEILRVALAKETQAHEFYSNLAAQCRVPIVRELAEKLKDEEYRHMRMVEEMITRLSLGRDAV
jgi:rubrerythrin